MNIIYRAIAGVALNSLALYGLTFIVEEITYTGGAKAILLGGLILGFINFFVKPLIKVLSLPLVFLTGGLFLIVINAGVLWFLQYFFEIAKFRDVAFYFPNSGSYVIGAIVIGVLNWALHLLIKNK